MKLPIALLFLFSQLPGYAQTAGKAERAILAVMEAQEKAWNQGDLATFMAGYQRSDSLKFIGSGGITYGWQQTLDNYKSGYPDRDAMGRLKFTILSVEKLSRKSAFVIGQWQLNRKSGDIGGYFTLLWKKIGGKWFIVADHSS